MFRYFFTVLLLIVSVSTPIFLSSQEANPVELAEETSTEENSEPENIRPSLSDIEGHWAEAYIDNLYQTEVVNGYSDGRFGPDDLVTRTQFLIISLRAFHYEVPDENYADFAYSVGVISNLDLWKNAGNDPVSRAEALKILLSVGNLEPGTELTPNFNDVDIVNDWFAVYSAFAKAQGILTGDAEGNFNGKNNVSRAETCALVVRIMERLPSDEEL